MGTPEFAVPSLEILIKNGFNIVAVITAPDKPQGRGQKIVPSPVKACAEKYQIPVLQPPNLKSPLFLHELKELNANLQIVVAFRMLPEAVWSMPEYGTFNLHGSLLPNYRGAAPINWAIINGETETGVTTFFLQHDIDTGNIIFQEKEPITADDTVGTLYQRLMHKGAALVLKTVQAIEQGQFESVPQTSQGKASHAPKIFKETCQINWDQPSEMIRNFVRGLNPIPTAWTTIAGKTFKVYQVKHVTSDNTDTTPGSWESDQKNFLHVRTKDGWLELEEIQPEGKRKMHIREFLMGNKLEKQI